ncbi:MAG: Fungalysin metallopeptidase (M36) [Candidatus Methanoperedens nitroreducens]|uniref:Fungalysin metallopeptidase (M36) n=1 Tax=Candidatus Methanoperedens nitratireducens TaxID=1392998 RepID=A0A0P7ZH75_9EURY|nr:MAG: Fungalysin metallopeptidase (M36) [Candidatus Methanoperedens sp. BLZ1]
MVNTHRSGIKPIKLKPTKSQLNALEKLKRLDSSLHVIWSKRGIPSHLCGILSVEIGKDPERIARKFLLDNFKLFKIKENLKDLTLIKKMDSLGGCHVLFQQFVDELPVYNAFTSVHMDKKNILKKVDVCYYPDLNIEPWEKNILQEEAIRIAIDFLNAEKRLSGKVSGELVIYPKKEKYYAAWKITVPFINPIEEWYVFLDCKNGKILDILDVLLKATGRGRVFIPNPVVALGDSNLTAESEIPDRAYSTVVLKELDGSGYLRGTYVDTCSTPNRAKEQDLTFYYKRNDPRFKEVMAYYHIDEAQRYIQSLGFTNICNRPINVNVHGDFVDNSYYNSDTKELTFGKWYIDDAEDADIILHEYCHAILDEQVPGFGLNWNTCPIAEGFGDFFAACFFAEINDGFNRECIGDWNGIGKIGNCVSRVDSKKHYPDDYLGIDSCDRDGEIWSAALWDIYLRMGGASRIKAKRLAARDNAIRLIIESNFNLNINSKFEDAADAIIIADKNIYDGASEHLIREVLVKRGILFPLVKVEMQAKVEPHAVQPGRILTFSISMMNAGEVDWKRAKVVISIHDEKHIMIKKLIKRINNLKIGERKSVESPWRIPKRMKNGEYGYTVSAYYSRKKIGSETGKFRVIV